MWKPSHGPARSLSPQELEGDGGGTEALVRPDPVVLLHQPQFSVNVSRGVRALTGLSQQPSEEAAVRAVRSSVKLQAASLKSNKKARNPCA